MRVRNHDDSSKKNVWVIELGVVGHMKNKEEKREDLNKQSKLALKDIFDTLIWYVIWLRVETKERKLNCECCVEMEKLTNLDRFIS